MLTVYSTSPYRCSHCTTMQMLNARDAPGHLTQKIWTTVSPVIWKVLVPMFTSPGEVFLHFWMQFSFGLEISGWTHIYCLLNPNCGSPKNGKRAAHGWSRAEVWLFWLALPGWDSPLCPICSFPPRQNSSEASRSGWIDHPCSVDTEKNRLHFWR